MALAPAQFEALKSQLAAKKAVTGTAPAFQTPQSPTDTAKDVAVGAAKGLGDTAIGTANILQKGGRYIQALLDPKNTYADLTRQANEVAERSPLAAPLDGKNKEGIDQMLKADNDGERAGKVVQAIGSLFFPVGKASEVSSVVNKGKQVAGAQLEGIGSRLSSVSDDVKERVVDVLSSLDDKTKTALKRTPREIFDDFVIKGRAAMQDDRNRTPLEAVGDNIIEGLTQVKNRASQAGQAKSKIMEQAKVGYKKVGNIAQRTALDIQKAFSGLKLDDADSKVVSTFQQRLSSLGDNPSLKEVDATIDLLQDQLYKKTSSSVVEVTDRVTGKLRAELAKLNDQVKVLGGTSYAKLNDEYADLIGTVTELNKRLGSEGASAGSFVKRLFSPSDARTKQLFEKLEKLTGQDFTRDARLAKFVMEVLGDTRAKSLLEELPTNATGAVAQLVNFAKKKLSDPLKAAERFIDRQ